MLNLAFSVFPEGWAGFHLDALAREPLWQAGIDFGHGTGHGIGYLLCVHEPPIGFCWCRTDRYDTGVLHAGMVISDEPGVYIAGSHGLRIENQILCVPAEHESFLRFDILTLAPIDLDSMTCDGWTRKAASGPTAITSVYMTRSAPTFLRKCGRGSRR